MARSRPFATSRRHFLLQQGALLATAGAGLLAARPAHAAVPRILHVASYRMDWVWNKEQLAGFKEGLGLPDAEFRIVELDAKHKDAARRAASIKEATALIEQWKPDLVYTNDDYAQSEVAVKYLNADLPFVYSGVNKEHADYGFDRSKNITGVLEREHFLGTLALLRSIKPMGRMKLAIVMDDDPTWVGVKARILKDLARREDIEAVQWLQPQSFDEYKALVTGLQGKVDALGTLGIFRFTKSGGGFADYEEVSRWTVENSRLPDFSFWDTRVERGTLCSVTVSGSEQGRLAGKMARRILVDKVAPAAITPEPTAKGRPMISLARARRLGLQIDAGVLLGAEVLPRFVWES
ncbi:MAG TPA: ABC transporter substrate binding protein [Burkholderiaceae bacterium]|nr:ABC transporter substrate binding protein [Burkholderiaceae bacterium]HMY99670.1 ABC transporter substrate binding protein [Burkholderiaceae bacterium]HNB43805.1 ABC transporter substrate binding protein [Burkholderiaceae bacterium]HNG80646.1 ABC transporter substrate binding protein [Burkholderiaceae bacterium]